MNILRIARPDRDHLPYGRLLLAGLFALALAACGQRGPLFLPDSQSGAHPAAGVPADDQSTNDAEHDEGKQDDGGDASRNQQS